MSKVQTLEVPATDDGSRLDRWFKRLFPHIPHGRVEKLLRTGQLRVDGKRAKGSHRLSAGEMVRVPPLPDPTHEKPKKRPGREDQLREWAIFEDSHIIVLNKPFGLAVQGGTKTTRHIDGMLPEGWRLVHRLDRDTTGVLVIAKSAADAKWAGKAFQSKRAVKTYWAVTNGVPKPTAGEIKGYLAKGRRGLEFGRKYEGQEIMVAARHGSPGAKHARTLYHAVQKAGSKAAFVVMRPLTGRTHQLRVHAQLLGAPIANDPKYMTDRPAPRSLQSKLHLHARELTLPKPAGDKSGGGTYDFTAPLPEHMTLAFDRLGFTERHDAINWDELA